MIFQQEKLKDTNIDIDKQMELSILGIKIKNKKIVYKAILFEVLFKELLNKLKINSSKVKSKVTFYTKKVLDKIINKIRSIDLKSYCKNVYLKLMQEYLPKVKFKLITLKNVVVTLFKDVCSSYKNGGFKEVSNCLKNFANDNKTQLKRFGHVALPVCAIIMLFSTIGYCNHLNCGLIIKCEGKEIATIEDEHVFEQASNMINQRLVCSEQKDIPVAHASYKLAVVKTSKCSSAVDVCDKIIEQSHDVIEDASGLYVDDQLVGVLKDSTDIDNLLKQSLNNARTSEDITDVSFVQKVEMIKGLYPTDSIVDTETIKGILTKPVEDEMFYTVVDGDTPSQIAARYNMSLEELNYINQGQLDDLMYAGKQVKVKVAKNLLSVKISKQESYDVDISYNTITTDDDSEYTDYRCVSQKGVNGVERCVDKVSYVNGVEVSRESVSKDKISDPVDEKITVGTKKRSSSYSSGGTGKSTGDLMWPVPYTRSVSSGFGYRWGCFHSGIDISSSGIHGKDIVAADGGTVRYVEYDSYGYGYHLVIDHGNGISTLYGHCSNIYVNSGDKISKGQTIAAVGSTGDSTGSHLHFEVIVNGSKQNPLNYVG